MKIQKREGGIALIFSLGVLAVLLAMGLAFLSHARLEQKAAGNYLDHVKCGFVMRAGIEHALAVLKSQKDDGYDSFESSWRTVLEGADYDNSKDGFEDSGWIEIAGPDGVVSGRYAVLIQDESGKINLNRSGNLSVELDEDLRAHGRSDGWTTFEISIADVLSSLGFSNSSGLAEDIIRARYGGHPDAGEYGFNLGIPYDGIDNDGSGSVESIDPLGFTPWKPAVWLAQDPFIELTQTAVLAAAFRYGMDILTEHASVHSRSPEMYIEGGQWKPKVNLNLFDSPLELYNAVSGADGIDEEEACRYAVNILDYRDENIWISEFESPVTGNIYYGVESVMINEVLCNSFMEDRDTRVNNSDGVMTFTYSGLAPDTAYRVSVGLGYSSNPANVRFRVGSGAWQSGASGGGVVIYRHFDYADFQNSLSDSDGNITISTDYDKTRIVPEAPRTGSVSIQDAQFTAAEFVELVNISADEVELDGWEIEVVSGGAAGVNCIPPASIPPGGYLVLTNDLPLFEASYGQMNAVEITGWESGYSTCGEFSCCGSIEICLHIDRSMGLLADILFDGDDYSAPGIASPGQSSGIGVSREKRDPALRSFWFDNYYGRASPGGDNDMMPSAGFEALEGLRDGSWPPLVKNGHFASPGEIIETPDWQGEGLKYAGVRGGSTLWGAVPPEALGRMAERISAGHYLRFDAGAADISEDSFGWAARLDRNSGSISYSLFFYGGYMGGEDDIVIDGEHGFAFKRSGGVCVGKLYADAIGRDGSFSFEISGGFEFAALAPDSVHGKININTASAEVLRGLPGVCAPTASGIISKREEEPFNSIGGLLLRGAVPPAQFAPIANLVSVNSDVFRVICTASIPHPSDPEDPELFTARRSAEIIVDRSGGALRVISWKELHE